MNLQGKYLLARPIIIDPWFKKAVVFIYEHTPLGAAGLLLNKPTSAQMSKLQGGGLPVNFNPVYDDTLYTGGPVNEQAIIMMHTSEWFSKNTNQINKEISISSDKFMIEKVLSGNVPKGFRCCTGMCAWHQGQLESEINRNHWLCTKLDLSIVFDLNGHQQWQIAIEKVAKSTIDKYII